jgi:hypothetical protein
MATTTPNFGWPVPTSSDLVKNGATAIEGLGDAIDASLLDLKGGTTGQVLAKTSGTDMDFTWTTSSAGMTNPMTTTGDTIYSSSGSTPARLGIGTTGQVLTVSGGVPTWATAGGGSLPTFSASKITTDQTFAANTFVKITFNSEAWDTNNNFASSTFTPTVAGYYQITAALYHGQVGNGDFQGALYKNGTRVKRLYIRNTIAGQVTLDNSSCLVYCNGSTDYIELYGRGDSGGDVTIYASAETTYFEGIGIRA